MDKSTEDRSQLQPNPTGERRCPSCNAPHREHQYICAACGALLFELEMSTLHVRDHDNLLQIRRKRRTPGGTGLLSAGHLVTLQIRGLMEKLWFEDGTGIVLGRLDLTNMNAPRFDLTRFGGHERGVSREHCLLRYHEGKLSVTDLGSVNGTYVNLDRLKPHVPRMLRDGDEMMLGNLRIVVYFSPNT